MGDYLRVRRDEMKIAKVVGENEDGITLFVPKDMDGVFHLSEGDRFVTMLFIRQDGHGGAMIYTPWED